MFKLTLTADDDTLASFAFDINELDALRQTILLGLDDAFNAELEAHVAALFAAALRDHT